MNKKLPFFAYGFFKPGELAYHKICDLVKDTQEAKVKGALFDKDGIPILVDQSSCREHDDLIRGSIIVFKEGKEEEGYEQVCSIEPDTLYRWKEIETEDGKKVNALVALQKILEKINIEAEHSVRGGVHIKKRVMEEYDAPHVTPEWHGSQDVLFNEGMCFLKAFIHHTQKENTELIEAAEKYKLRELHWLTHGLISLFQEQMAYAFLWTIIDRHNSMKYRIGSKDMSEQRKELANDRLFKKAVQKFVPINDRSRMIVVASDSDKTEVVSDSNKGNKSFESIVKYYYQIRCNVVHRGKAGIDMKDEFLLKKALRQLYNIIEYMLSEELPLPKNTN